MAIVAYVDSVIVGGIKLPPDGMSGHAWLACTPKEKLDKKTATGKSGSRVTLQGEENADCTLKVQLNGNGVAFYQAAASLLRDLIKLMRTGPQGVQHVNAEACDVAAVQFEEFPNGLVPAEGKLTFECKGVGWSSAAQTGQTCQLLLLRGSTDASTSGEVTRWQTFLSTQGYYTGAIDGVFGVDVDTATRAFQTDKAVKVDGIVGPQTFGEAAKLGYTAPAPKSCGSATKTPAKASSADEYGPPTEKELAKAQRKAAMDAWAKTGIPPNEAGEGLPDGFGDDPYAAALQNGGKP